ncbi:MAG: PEP-CTERM sorting domain-containing protein [Verrucomicrobiota bacterium]
MTNLTSYLRLLSATLISLTLFLAHADAAINASFTGPIASPDILTDLSPLPATDTLPAPAMGQADGVNLSQIDSSSSISTNFLLGQPGRSWFPNGGDNGYTEISLTSGEDFDAISFYLGAGGLVNFLGYQVLDDGASLVNSTISWSGSGWYTIQGDSGEIFDEVRLLASVTNSVIGSGATNALAVVQVAVSVVPEPSTAGLFVGIGALAFVGARRK